jgi:L-amino acid N-acyltransferase YncA
MKSAIFALWRILAGLHRPSKTANARRLRSRGETVPSLRIREATAADIAALARLHMTTWNATYAPLLMKGPSYAIRERQWREAFTKNDGSWFCFVVERPDGELAGFAKGKRSDHPEFAGELNKIYLLREYQRIGLGRRLLGQVANRFLSEGVTSMCCSATREIHRAASGRRLVPRRRTTIPATATMAGGICGSSRRCATRATTRSALR